MTSPKEAETYQELIEIVGMRHLLISTKGGVNIYSETFFEQVTSVTASMLKDLIANLDNYVLKFNKEKTEFSQFMRPDFYIIARKGDYTQITLISEATTTEVTKKRLRTAQNALEANFENVLELSFVDLTKIPVEEVRTICQHSLHTNLLYGLTINEKLMDERWNKLNKLERKTMEAARCAIQLTEHKTLYLNSWVSEMRLQKISEPNILKGIYAVTNQELVEIKQWKE